jgi:hypothetical protein
LDLHRTELELRDFAEGIEDIGREDVGSRLAVMERYEDPPRLQRIIRSNLKFDRPASAADFNPFATHDAASTRSPTSTTHIRHTPTGCLRGE